MTNPREEEEPGHVGKLPQDVGSTRLVPSSTSRKKKKSDLVSDKVALTREKKRMNHMKIKERRKKDPEFDAMMREKKRRESRRLRKKIKEKRKKVSCAIYDSVACLILSILTSNYHIIRIPILTQNGRNAREII